LGLVGFEPTANEL